MVKRQNYSNKSHNFTRSQRKSLILPHYFMKIWEILTIISKREEEEKIKSEETCDNAKHKKNCDILIFFVHHEQAPLFIVCYSVNFLQQTTLLCICIGTYCINIYLPVWSA